MGVNIHIFLSISDAYETPFVFSNKCDINSCTPFTKVMYQSEITLFKFTGGNIIQGLNETNKLLS